MSLIYTLKNHSIFLPQIKGWSTCWLLPSSHKQPHFSPFLWPLSSLGTQPASLVYQYYCQAASVIWSTPSLLDVNPAVMQPENGWGDSKKKMCS